MKRTHYLRVPILVAIVAAVAIMSLPALGAATKTTDHYTPAQPGSGPGQGTQGAISITITDQGLKKQVGEAPYGSYRVTITNQSSRARGLIFTGTGLGGTPFYRFTDKIQPGGDQSFDYFFAPGKVVIRDWLNANRTSTAYTNVSYGPFSSSIVFSAPAGSPAAAGAGPGQPREVEARGETGTAGVVLGTIPISITNQGIQKTMGTANFGTYDVVITNNSSRARGLYFTGTDLCCTTYHRYSSMIQPGGKTSFRFFFAPGKVVIRDFLSARKTNTAYANVKYGPHSSSIVFE